MVRVFREVRRVLHDTGTLFLNMGDSFGPGKQLVMMPHRLALAMQSDGWIVRMDCIWAKPNPMPESVTDRPTKSHEYVFLLTKQDRYYFDADAVREAHNGYFRDRADEYLKYTPPGQNPQNGLHRCHKSGRNIRSVWTIPSEAYPGSHFATFPRKLVEPCIKAGTSDKGCCPTCGAPWERVTEPTAEYRKMIEAQRGAGDWFPRANGYKDATDGNKSNTRRNGNTGTCAAYQTLGWRPTCSQEAEPVPCVILDPFAGSGTTGVVALALKRRFVGCDLSREYLGQAKRRIERPHQPGIRQREQSMPLLAGLEP